MKKSRLVTYILVLLFSLFAFVPLSEAKTSGGNNYLNEVSVSKWNTNTLKVWVQSSEYQATAYQALSEWETASGGCVKFRVTNNETAANIRIYFVDNIPGHAVGVTRMSKPAIIKIQTNREGKKISKIPKKQAYAIILHEIGHGLGINGHSSNINDIMFPSTDLIGYHTSARDFNTIRSIYCR